MRHVLDIVDLSKEEINALLKRAEDIIDHPKLYRDACRYKKLATLFYEPSTRTRLSFEAAMLELGGAVIGFEAGTSSSTTKGETVGDTVRTVSQYADVIVMRHPNDGAPYAAIQRTEVPVINAGDGGHNHPTQTLADILTIHKKQGRLNDLTIGLCGDLKYGRTVHSLIRALIRYNNVRFVCISPKELSLPDYILQLMDENNVEYKITDRMEEYMADLDVLYMTRVQQERFDTKAEYERLKDCYILTTDKLRTAKPTMSILHPLPRVNEISYDVDDDPRAAYFDQVAFGKYMRMALILELIDDAEKGVAAPERVKVLTDKHCTNPRCIACREDLKPYAVNGKSGLRCYYCEALLK